MISIHLLVLMTSWVSHKFDYLMDNEKFPFHYVYFWISYYPERHSYNCDKAKVVIIVIKPK